MQRLITSGCLLAIAALLPAQSTGPDKSGWYTLFDGKSLGDWKANENPGSFKLSEGKLVVHGPRAHLFYVGPVSGAEFENFIVEVEAQTKKGANSGFFFHTKWQESGWPAHGYEAQINTTHGDTIKTGSVYAVRNVTKAASADEQWFKMAVEVRRKNIVTKVNGKKLVDYDEPIDISGTRRLSRGTFAIQAHDPNSEVWIRKVRVKLLPSWRPDLSRADLVTLRKPDKWWNRMDYGPFVSSTVGIGSRGKHAALKGITVALDREDRGSMTFDTDLLRMVGGWEGSLTFTGTTYDGRHGGHPYIEGTPTFHTRALPGWSDPSGALGDTRPIPHGPVPDEHGRYRGLYRHGDRVVLEYEVGGARIREMPERIGRTLIRNLDVDTARNDRLMVVADAGKGEAVEILDGGRAAVIRPQVARARAGKKGPVQVTVDRTEAAWGALATGAPAKDDALASRTERKVRVSWATSHARPHGRSGARDGDLPRVNDGDLPANQDQPERVTFFDGGRARMYADLGAPQKLRRVNTFSWHKSDRAPQRFVLWAADGDEAPSMKGNLAKAGWKKIAKVDSTALGLGGKHASSVDGRIGNFRWLLWDMTPLQNQQGCFIAEVDVWTTGHDLSALKTPAHRAPGGSLACALSGAPKGVRLEAVEHDGAARLMMRVPAGTPRSAFRLAYNRALQDGHAEFAKDLAPSPDLDAYTAGGPSQYPQPVVVKGKLAKKNDKPWVVDDVPIPFDNPWNSYMRIGGLDLFSDGTSAAVSTWNGDVWVVSGLDDDLDEVKWRRYATGLFETLGLRIVDDVVYVNGKDQITRLHDLDKDGEADFYECFNNDVYTTRNFHEFTFDLQTDSAGNFYISKGAPVRSGGRGFEKIIPHHGTVLKIAKDGSKLEVYARGMRAPNGIGVGPDGQVTSGDNEGTWVPRCKLHWLQPGSFQGVMDVAHTDEAPKDYNKPLCWFPMSVDNSGGGQVWVPEDERWGPYGGDLLHLSYGKSAIYKVMKEEVDGQIQGGVFKIPVKLGSSAMRARFNPKDGQLWVVGLRGWQTNAARLTAFQRVRRTKAPVNMPTGLRVTERGVYVTFTCDLDKELANDTESYSVKWWNYVWSPQYGSPEVSADKPDPAVLEKAQKTELKGHRRRDKVTVKSATLQPDKRTVFLEIPGIKPVMQMHLKVDLESTGGDEITIDIWNTINKLGRDQSN
ncbi:MAG: family 16 glycoside hydrolase [Planctomycetota bacterium]|nr:family 16 glycoside hydrolase [Planctomycetota bacterium]